MARSRSASPQTAAVMIALATEARLWRYGYDLCQETGLKAGTMYPILMRLADQGLLETKWEQTHVPGRPPRHLYRLTASGLALAAQIGRTTKPTREVKPSRRQIRLEGTR